MKKLLLVLGMAILALTTSCTPDDASVDGRWNGFMEKDSENYAISYILNAGKADIYVLAWGEHYIGTYTQNGSNITFAADKAYVAEKRTETSTEGGHDAIADQETFALNPGFQWYEVTDPEELAQIKSDVSDQCSIVLDSATTGHGNAFGLVLSFKKAK